MAYEESLAAVRTLLALSQEEGLRFELIRVGEVEVRLGAPPPQPLPTVSDGHTSDPELEKSARRQAYEASLYGAADGDLPDYDPEEFAALSRALS